MRAIISSNLKGKFKSFGWETVEVDGHNLEEVDKTIFENRKDNSKPYCIIANTDKGKGVKEIEENIFTWHHKCPTEEDCKKFKKEIFLS